MVKDVTKLSDKKLENRVGTLEDKKYDLEDKQGEIQGEIEEREIAGNKSSVSLEKRFEAVSNQIEKVEDEIGICDIEIDRRAGRSSDERVAPPEEYHGVAHTW